MCIYSNPSVPSAIVFLIYDLGFSGRGQEMKTFECCEEIGFVFSLFQILKMRGKDNLW